MLLTLYKTLDGDNVINKVLTDPANFNINLKRDVDIINPSLLMTTLEGVDYKEFNYAHIPELGRFYFIRGVDLVNASLWRLDCECDFLETYKTDILNSSAMYKTNIKTGDYGEIKPDTTGRVNISEYVSGVELVKKDNAILSVIGGI